MAEVAAGVADRLAGMPPHRAVVFIVTSLVSARLRDAVSSYAAERGVACEFWAATELDERIKRHPGLVQEFFRVPSGWFVEDEVVVPRRLPHAPLRFVNRTPELASLDRLLDRSRQSPGPSMAVISGLHGVGKDSPRPVLGNQRRGYFSHGDLVTSHVGVGAAGWMPVKYSLTSSESSVPPISPCLSSSPNASGCSRN